MSKQTLSRGTVHALPVDLQQVLAASAEASAAWEDITPLARNEFICWVENAKQIDTRKRRIQRTKEELLEGKRRPCCWVGCVHRQDKAPSPSQKFITNRSSKSA